MAIFGPKAWVNPFGKMSIFRLFELFFIAQKGDFLFQKILEHIFLAYTAFKKKLEKWQFFDQEHGITLWKNVDFLTFSTFRFYNLERCLLVLKYRKTHFPGLQCLKKKVGKMAIFGPKAWVNPLEKCEFFDFLNLFFYSLDRCYLVLEYRKRHFPGLYCLQKEVGKMTIFGPKAWVNLFEKC